MILTERQKKFLRREAHNLKPIVAIGDKGITDTVLNELDAALSYHELIKVSVRVGDRDARDKLIANLSDSTQATVLRRVGNIATLYRQNKKKPKLSLPA
jgi:RNA-binding protein